MILYVCGSRTSRSTSRPCSRVLCPAARLQQEVLRYSVVHCVVTDFTVTFSNRPMVPKMILRLGFVDLVDHVASSMLVRHVVLSEFSEPSGRAHPVSSYIPLSECKLQVVCCRERLHVTVSGKIASISLERASNCTNILYFKALPSILVWRDPWFRQIAWSFSHTISAVHRVHFSEEDRLSSSLEACFSWN